MFPILIDEMASYTEKRVILPRGSAIENEVDHSQS
jgi:hypothetical protein